MSSADVERHFGLVRLVLRQLRTRGQLARHVEMEEAEAVGRMAVFEALCRWTPAKGRQSTYLVPFIRGRILNYQRSISRPLGYDRERGQVATVASLDAPVSEDGRTLLDVLAEQPANQVHARFVELLRAAAELDGRERVVARDLLADCSIAETGRELGLSDGHARRLARSVRRALAEACA